MLEPIGKHIRLVDERNRRASNPPLLGVSIEKMFMPSVANTIGSNMANYKVVKKGQFACSLMQVRRDKKMPVALLRDYEEAIVSPAYPVFEIIDEDQLLPEYLMMWMLRPEFDREACFYAVGGVRGSLEWDDLCNIRLPVPTIEKQREIVKEYKTVVNRIRLNERLNEKLEEAAQAIYKQWFVEFEFPMTTGYAESIGKPELAGQPYKSSGGEMKYNEVLEQDIPKEWRDYALGELCRQVCVGFVGSCYESYCDPESGVPMLRTTDLTESGMSYRGLRYVTPEFHARYKKSQLHKADILVARHGSNGMPVIFDRNFEANCLNTIIVKPNEDRMGSKLLHEFLRSAGAVGQIRTSLGGSVQEVLNTKKLLGLRLAYPETSDLNASIAHFLMPLQSAMEVIRRELEGLGSMRDLIMSRLAVGTE